MQQITDCFGLKQNAIIIFIIIIILQLSVQLQSKLSPHGHTLPLHNDISHSLFLLPSMLWFVFVTRCLEYAVIFHISLSLTLSLSVIK